MTTHVKPSIRRNPHPPSPPVGIFHVVRKPTGEVSYGYSRGGKHWRLTRNECIRSFAKTNGIALEVATDTISRFERP